MDPPTTSDDLQSTDCEAFDWDAMDDQIPDSRAAVEAAGAKVADADHNLNVDVDKDSQAAAGTAAAAASSPLGEDAAESAADLWLLDPVQQEDAARLQSVSAFGKAVTAADADVAEAAASLPLEQTAKDWMVVYKHVVRRAEPSTTAKSIGMEVCGNVVHGDPTAVKGVPWLRMEDEKYGSAWMLIDGASVGLGPLLEPAPYGMEHVSGKGRALFARRDFECGETVIVDQPFHTRPLPKDVQQRKWTDEWTRAFSKISAPLKYHGAGARRKENQSDRNYSPYAYRPPEPRIYASPAMVRNALGFAIASPLVRKQILNMHYPNLDSDHPIVIIAGKVAELCIQHLSECKDISKNTLHAAILAVEMNVFSGGRCFTTLSLVNHSCAPNIVYVGMPGEWKFKALRSIKAGEELSHSYLGEELLLPTEQRRRHLWRSKGFDCTCDRCHGADTEELMRDIPCRRCTAELQSEPEWESFWNHGDHWVYEGNLWRALLGHAERPDYEETPFDEKWVVHAHSWCDAGGTSGAYMRFCDGEWRCRRCGASSVGEHAGDSAEFLDFELNLGRQAENTFFKPEMTPDITSNFKRRASGKKATLNMVKVDFVAGALDVACVVFNCLGMRHWATQWARLLCVDLAIGKLQFGPPGGVNDEVHLYVLLTLISLWDWIASLGLTHDPSCFLYSRCEAALELSSSRIGARHPYARWKYQELERRLEASQKQVEILPLRPMLVQDSVSFG